MNVLLGDVLDGADTDPVWWNENRRNMTKWIALCTDIFPNHSLWFVRTGCSDHALGVTCFAASTSSSATSWTITSPLRCKFRISSTFIPLTPQTEAFVETFDSNTLISCVVSLKEDGCLKAGSRVIQVGGDLSRLPLPC